MFEVLTKRHVTATCRQVIRDGVPARRAGRSTFLQFEGHSLPAKYVLGLAYELATGTPLSPDDFTGGDASADILRQLGFQVTKTKATSQTTTRRSRLKKPRPAKRPIRKHSSTATGPKPRVGKADLLDRLRRSFGEVEKEVSFPWLVVPDRNDLPADLNNIRERLVAYRGYDSFDTPGFSLRCDYYIPGSRLIIEVDERQHFTTPRRAALECYPASAPLGFDRDDWIAECYRVAASDKDPLYRDEQRAYYDSIRDLLAPVHGLRLIVRLNASLLDSVGGVDRAVELIAACLPTRSFSVGRLVVQGPAGFKPTQGEQILCKTLDRSWPKDTIVDFLVTPGGFLQTEIKERWQQNCGWTSQPDDIDAFVEWSKNSVDRMLTDRLFASAAGKVKLLSIGSDVSLSDGTHAELIFVLDVAKRTIIHWTGKSYPTSGQERSLVQVTNLDTHFTTLTGHRVMILGCHDLNMFSARTRANQNPKGVRRKRCDAMAKLTRRFKPTVVLQHPHSTDSPKIWSTPWACLARDYPSVKVWASGICYHNPEDDCRADLNKVLSGTSSGEDAVIDIVSK